MTNELSAEFRADHLLVLYASQTGNAEWIAKNIDKEAKLRGFQSDCLVMDQAFEKVPKLFEEPVLIFVSSTTGDGDPPDNAVKFWRHLRTACKSAADGDHPFASTLFTVCGIGDTNYSNFGAHPRKIEKKVLELGGTLFYPKVIADEVEGLENAIDPWIAGLWPALTKVCRPVGPDLSENNTSSDALLPGRRQPQQQQQTVSAADAVLAQVAQLSQQLKDEAIISADAAAAVESKNDNAVAHVIPLPALPEGVDQLSGLPKLPAALYTVQLESNNQTKTVQRTAVSQLYAAADERTEQEAVVDLRHPRLVSIIAGRYLSARGSVKRTLELELDVGQLEWEYQPGDSIGLICQNDDALVRVLLRRLSLEPDTAICVDPVSDDRGNDNHFALVKTVGELFRFCVDICSTPRKAFFRMLAEYSQQVDEKRMLLYLCSREGSDALKQLLSYTPTIVDLLETFPCSRPPLERLLDCLTLLHPRYYSICNSPLEEGSGGARVAFNIVEYAYPQPVSGQRFGVCTGWLDRCLAVKSELVASRPSKIVSGGPAVPRVPLADLKLLVPAFPNRTKDFLLPEDPTVPVIMIGPGTGVAPFVGFGKHRQQQRRLQPAANTVQWGPMWLFYGCRERVKDFLFHEELRGLESDGTLTRLIVSYSREQSSSTGGGPPIRYVQDNLLLYGAEVMEMMLTGGGKLYVCGDAKGMAKDVNETLIQLIIQHHQPKIANASEAMRLIGQWTADKRYVRDIWQ